MLPQIQISLGYVYDLVLILIMKLNPEEVWRFRYTPIGKEQEMMLRQQETLMQIPKLDPALRIFVYLAENPQERTREKKCLLMEVWERVWNLKKEKFNLSFLIQELSDTNRMIQEVWGFYFAAPYPETYAEVSNQIERSQLEQSIKFYLLSYFLQPDQYRQRLLEALEKIDQIYQEIYRQKQAAMMECVDRLDQRKLEYEIRQIWRESGKDEVVSFAVQYISFSALNKYTLCQNFELRWILIGEKWDQISNTLDRLEADDQSITRFLDVLGSKTKWELLKCVALEGRKNALQAAKQLTIKESIAARYLKELFYAGLLMREKEGKVFYYELNRRQLKEYLYLLWFQLGQP